MTTNDKLMTINAMTNFTIFYGINSQMAFRELH